MCLHGYLNKSGDNQCFFSPKMLFYTWIILVGTGAVYGCHIRAQLIRGNVSRFELFFIFIFFFSFVICVYIFSSWGNIGELRVRQTGGCVELVMSALYGNRKLGIAPSFLCSFTYVFFFLCSCGGCTSPGCREMGIYFSLFL